jgi:hypothetical protein
MKRKAYLSDVAYEIARDLRRYGLINVTQCKEKWGEVRVYCSFGLSSLHGMFYPGYVYNQFKPIMRWVDDKLFKPWFWRMINTVMIPYQEWIYSRVYNKAISKYFYYAPNIYYGADYTKTIKLTIYNKYLLLREYKKQKRIDDIRIKELEKELAYYKYPKTFLDELKKDD